MPQVTWQSSGKYWGLMVGPAKGHTSWSKPASKYLARLADWPWSQLGLHASMQVYNLHILPVLLFVSQYEHIPDDVLAMEATAVHRLAPGAGDWCHPGTCTTGGNLALQDTFVPSSGRAARL